MENTSVYQYGNKALNMPDVSGSELIEWLENQRTISIELKDSSEKCEFMLEVINKVKDMQGRYYRQVVECCYNHI